MTGGIEFLIVIAFIILMLFLSGMTGRAPRDGMSLRNYWPGQGWM